jgi:hypothetical protein
MPSFYIQLIDAYMNMISYKITGKIEPENSRGIGVTTFQQKTLQDYQRIINTYKQKMKESESHYTNKQDKIREQSRLIVELIPKIKKHLVTEIPIYPTEPSVMDEGLDETDMAVVMAMMTPEMRKIFVAYDSPGIPLGPDAMRIINPEKTLINKILTETPGATTHEGIKSLTHEGIKSLTQDRDNELKRILAAEILEKAKKEEKEYTEDYDEELALEIWEKAKKQMEDKKLSSEKSGVSEGTNNKKKKQLYTEDYDEELALEIWEKAKKQMEDKKLSSQKSGVSGGANNKKIIKQLYDYGYPSKEDTIRIKQNVKNNIPDKMYTEKIKSVPGYVTPKKEKEYTEDYDEDLAIEFWGAPMFSDSKQKYDPTRENISDEDLLIEAYGTPITGGYKGESMITNISNKSKKNVDAINKILGMPPEDWESFNRKYVIPNIPSIPPTSTESSSNKWTRKDKGVIATNAIAATAAAAFTYKMGKKNKSTPTDEYKSSSSAASADALVMHVPTNSEKSFVQIAENLDNALSGIKNPIPKTKKGAQLKDYYYLQLYDSDNPDGRLIELNDHNFLRLLKMIADSIGPTYDNNSKRFHPKVKHPDNEKTLSFDFIKDGENGKVKLVTLTMFGIYALFLEKTYYARQIKLRELEKETSLVYKDTDTRGEWNPPLFIPTNLINLNFTLMEVGILQNVYAKVVKNKDIAETEQYVGASSLNISQEHISEISGGLTKKSQMVLGEQYFATGKSDAVLVDKNSSENQLKKIDKYSTLLLTETLHSKFMKVLQKLPDEKLKIANTNVSFIGDYIKNQKDGNPVPMRVQNSITKLLGGIPQQSTSTYHLKNHLYPAVLNLMKSNMIFIMYHGASVPKQAAIQEQYNIYVKKVKEATKNFADGTGEFKIYAKKMREEYYKNTLHKLYEDFYNKISFAFSYKYFQSTNNMPNPESVIQKLTKGGVSYSVLDPVNDSYSGKVTYDYNAGKTPTIATFHATPAAQELLVGGNDEESCAIM